MPLHFTIRAANDTTLFVWNITESEQELSNALSITEKNAQRLSGMRSELHRRGFLAVRRLLEQNGYGDHDVTYDETGKPKLNDGRHISITHSHEFAAIAISGRNIGIDMEMQREKVLVIAHKFIDKEYEFLDRTDTADFIRRLTVIWGAKEALFKVRNEIGISYKDHIFLEPFIMEQQKATLVLQFNNKETRYIAEFCEIDNYIMVWIVES